MRARVVLVRGGLGVAALTLCVLLVVSIFGGQAGASQPAEPVAEITLTRPSLPAWPDAPRSLAPGLTDTRPDDPRSARRYLGGPDAVIARPRHESPPAGLVVPAGGYNVTGPATPAAPPG